jgi:hypothetical protein
MTEFYLDDDRDYSEVIESWVRNFMDTMDHDDDLEPGNDSGDTPTGVKIIFDGFGIHEYEDEEGNYICEENGDRNMVSFAVFIHKNSLTEEFPPHDLTPWALIHRPKEECCIYVWYNREEDEMDVIPFEENNSTELDSDFVVELIHKIQERDST